MYRNFIKKKLTFPLSTFFSILIFIFFVSHILFGERSVWKIFDLKSQISHSLKEYEKLVNNKNKILIDINLLKDENLDPDLIYEISHKNLGLIQSDQIILDFKN
jgi:cell division protein FtsB